MNPRFNGAPCVCAYGGTVGEGHRVEQTSLFAGSVEVAKPTRNLPGTDLWFSHFERRLNDIVCKLAVHFGEYCVHHISLPARETVAQAGLHQTSRFHQIGIRSPFGPLTSENILQFPEQFA